ncbi:MAG: transglycosylase SLT domain-containing protein, partial [Actinobacteria bacterium]|nr:transglycosylase SLT domain-containing protein [Actinomycetota bacterium]
YHWAQWQFRYLSMLWMRESGWNPHALNPGSGAYGIPQAVPGAKMASAGPDWRWNPRTQIRWGLTYIAGRYGSPLNAWQHESDYGWY